MTIKNSDLKKLAMQWKAAAPALHAQRLIDIRRQDNARAIEALNSIFRQAIKDSPPRTTSGLVEMYKVLQKTKANK